MGMIIFYPHRRLLNQDVDSSFQNPFENLFKSNIKDIIIIFVIIISVIVAAAIFFFILKFLYKNFKGIKKGTLLKVVR
jgi:predicted permease